MRQAQPRACAACGAPQPAGRRERCVACQTVLVPLGAPDPRASRACARCLAIVSASARFCPDCGHAQPGTERPGEGGPCPRCGPAAPPTRRWRAQPEPVDASAAPGPIERGVELDACGECGGVWIAAEDFRRAVARWERAAPRGAVDPAQVPRLELTLATRAVRYLRCPTCGVQMQRRNFGGVSGVVVDECRGHGVFLDAGELDAIRRFVGAGGLALSERHEARERARLERQAAAHRPAAAEPMRPHEPSFVEWLVELLRPW